MQMNLPTTDLFHIPALVESFPPDPNSKESDHQLESKCKLIDGRSSKKTCNLNF